MKTQTNKLITLLFALTMLLAARTSCSAADDFAGAYEGFLTEYDNNIKDGVVIQQSLTNRLNVSQTDPTHYTTILSDCEGHQATVACVRAGQVLQNVTKPLSYSGWNLQDFIMISDGTNKAYTVIGQDKVDSYDVSFTVSAWSEHPSPITADDFVGSWEAVQYSNPNLRDGSGDFNSSTGLTFTVTKTGPNLIKAASPKVSFSMLVSNNVAMLVSPPVNAGAGLTHTFRMCTDGSRMTACLVATELSDPTDVSVTLMMGEKVSGPPPAIRDLAVISIKAAKTLTLTEGKSSQTKYVLVTIQNRGNRDEIISDLATLADLVTLEVESLGGTCTNPVAVFLEGPPQRPLPVTLKPKQKFNVVFNVTYDCANDPTKNVGGDFRYIAEVRREVLDGIPDADPADDVCPHDAPAGGVDPVNPAIKDKGAGGKKPDKTLGADVVTDVIVK